MPILVPITPFVPRRKRRPRAQAPAAAPVLVAATFDTSDGAVLTLTFDRDVEIAVWSPPAVVVDDQPGEGRYDGGAGATLVSPNVVRVEMGFVEVIPIGASVVLSASGATGVVAVEGGAAWGGVTDLALPWP